MKVKGQDRLKRALEGRGRAVRRALDATAMDGARAVAAGAAARCPEDTGTLAASIEAVRLKASRGRVAAAAVCDGGRDHPMPADVEFGNSRQAAQPFLRPAAREEAPRIRREGADSVRRALS